jgi:hypothetical protein
MIASAASAGSRIALVATGFGCSRLVLCSSCQIRRVGVIVNR